MKDVFKLKALTIALIVSGTIALSGCEEEYEQVKTTEKEVVYVQNNDGQWMTYIMFMQLMNNNNHGAINYNSYHYSTRGADGKFKPYTPSKSEFSSMKSNKFTGNHTYTKVSSVPKKSSMVSGFKSTPTTTSTAKSTTSTAKTGSFGGSSSRASGNGG